MANKILLGMSVTALVLNTIGLATSLATGQIIMAIGSGIFVVLMFKIASECLLRLGDQND